MKTYSKTFISTFAFLVYLLSFSLAYSNKSHQKAVFNIDSVGNSTHQEIIDEFVRVANNELAQIIAQNAINDLNGESQKNNYIFGFEPNKMFLNNNYIAQYKQILVDSTSLNNHLVTLNTTLKTQGKPLIYVGIDALLGDILSKIKVSGIQTTAKLEQITIQKQDFASFETINNTYKSIYDNIGNNLPYLDSNHPNGMIIIGYGVFKKYTIDGEVDSDELSTAYIKSKIKGKRWQFCNFKEKKQGSQLGQGSDAFRALVFQNFSQFPESPEPDDVQEHLQNFATQVYNSLTGDKVFIPKGRLHKDFYAPDGEYRQKLDADVTEEQVLKVNALIEEMMDDPLYTNYIKPAITAKTQGGDKLKQADLISMEKALKDLKEACSITYGGSTSAFLTQMLDYLKMCSASVYQPCEATTYIPRCLWDNSNPTLPYSSFDIAFSAGIVDGVIETVWSVLELGTSLAKANFNIQHMAFCWLPGLSMFDASCKKEREESKKYWEIMSDFPKTWNSIGAIVSQVTSQASGDFMKWSDEITSFDNCGRYRQGRLFFDIASCFIGVGELKVAQKGFSLTSYLGNFAQKAKTTLGKFSVQAGKAYLKRVTANVGSKARAVTTATLLSASLTGSEQVLMHVGPSVAQNQKVQQLIRSVADDVTMTVKLPVESETFLTETIANEIAGTTTREIVAKAEAETLETVKELANSTQRPLKTIPISAGEKIETSVVTGISNRYLAVEVVNSNNSIRKLIAATNITGNTFSKLKPKKEDSGQSDCQVCATKLTNSASDQSLCNKLKNLASKSTTNGTLAVNRLCINIALKTTLEAVVDKVLTFSQADIEAFLADINGGVCTANYLCGNISNINVDIINAWKTLVDNVNNVNRRTDLAQDFPLLTKVNEIITNQTKLNAFTNPTFSISSFGEFINTYKVANCNTCKISAGSYGEWMPLMDEILDNSLDAQLKYLGTLGYGVGHTPDSKGFASNEPFNAGANQWLRDGGQHMLKGMRAVLNLSNNRTLQFSPTLIQAFDEPFGTSNNPNYASKQCDIRLGTNQAGVVFVEFKSYQEETELTSKGMEQFLGYLSDNRVQNLNNLVYVFNARKSSLQAAKQKMQKVFQGAKANDIFNAIYPKMAVNLGLDINDPIIARQLYNQWVNNLDNKIFGFVIVN